MTLERDQGRITCRECGQVWVTDEATAELLEELVSHTAERHPDDTRPAVHLRGHGHPA